MTIESKILEEIKNGCDPVDIVIKYGVDPDVVIKLYDRYLEQRLSQILYQVRQGNVEFDYIEPKVVQPILEKPIRTNGVSNILSDNYYNLDRKFKKISETRPKTEKNVTLFDLEIPGDLLVLFIISCFITLLDILTTRIALNHPNLYEMNPLMQFLMKYLDVERALLVNAILSIGALFGLTLLSARSKDIVWRILPLTVYSTIRIIPVMNNYKLILKVFHLGVILTILFKFI
jgi:hypothetical protein